MASLQKQNHAAALNFQDGRAIVGQAAAEGLTARQALSRLYAAREANELVRTCEGIRDGSVRRN